MVDSQNRRNRVGRCVRVIHTRNSPRSASSSGFRLQPGQVHMWHMHVDAGQALKPPRLGWDPTRLDA